MAFVICDNESNSKNKKILLNKMLQTSEKIKAPISTDKPEPLSHLI